MRPLLDEVLGGVCRAHDGLGALCKVAATLGIDWPGDANERAAPWIRYRPRLTREVNP